MLYHKLYHVSKTPGLKTLLPRVSTHGKAYVYAIEDLTTGLLFGARQDDFDFHISTDESGKPVVCECYPGAFEKVYKGKSCSVYEVSGEGFLRGMTSWEPELVCGQEVSVLCEIFVEDLYERLLMEEQNGNLTVCRYEFSDGYRQKIAAHIVDRIFRFGIDLEHIAEEDARFAEYYNGIVKALSAAADGRLLR